MRKNRETRWSPIEYLEARASGRLRAAARALAVGVPLAILTAVGVLPGTVGWTLVAVCSLAVVLSMPWHLVLPRNLRARRSPGGFGFRPSAATRPVDRLTTAPHRHERPWLTRGEESEVALILAPGVWPQYAGAATHALDEASYDILSPVKPPWFQHAERLGALTFLATAALGFGVVHALTHTLPSSLAAALLSGWMFGHLLDGALETAARQQAGRAAAAHAQQVLTENTGLLRPLQPANLRVVGHLLDRGEVDETRLHHLAFQAAGTDSEADRAAGELERLTRGQPVA
jgi:hypothetical protein